MTFPLYDNLYDLPDVKFTQKELKNNLEKMDETGKERVYALIKWFDNMSDEQDRVIFKNTKSDDSGITFALNKLPKKLRNILIHFTRDHIKCMKLEAERKILSSMNSS